MIKEQKLKTSYNEKSIYGNVPEKKSDSRIDRHVISAQLIRLNSFIDIALHYAAKHRQKSHTKSNPLGKSVKLIITFQFRKQLYKCKILQENLIKAVEIEINRSILCSRVRFSSLFVANSWPLRFNKILISKTLNFPDQNFRDPSRS